MQGHLALSCKATLPILGMGHVRMRTDEPEREGHLLKAMRCLMKQPGGVSHLHVSGMRTYADLDPRHLMDLRCAHALLCLTTGAAICVWMPLLLLCQSSDSTQDAIAGNATLCFRSLLSNLRTLSMDGVAVFLPALQPVATRLRQLSLFESRLQGSPDGFLTRGWTALTTLSLADARVETASVTAALELPALEELDINGFRHQGGVLQLDQLTGSCPNIRGLRLRLDSDLARGREGSGPCCSLLKLGRLADLYMKVHTLGEPLYAALDFDLPASLSEFEVEGARWMPESHVVDLFWALREAVKCVSRGAQLRNMTCRYAVAHLQPAQWGASLDEQYRLLGGQLSGLRELEVWGVESVEDSLLSAVSAVVSSAPSLVGLKLSLYDMLPHLELPAISSASLESFAVDVFMSGNVAVLPPVVLTFLPGCTRLRQVLVGFVDEHPNEGTVVKIRCHSGSPTCIVPLGLHASQAGRVRTDFGEVGVELLPGPPCPQGVQSHTVLHICHFVGPQQAFVWCHAVVPGFL